MGVLHTAIAMRCRRCGAPLATSMVATSRPDPDGSRLDEIVRNLGKIALCPFHQRQRDHYASIGRSHDWEIGNL